MDLVAHTPLQGVAQDVTLEAGNYLLEFEYSTRPQITLIQNSFKVYFNGVQVLNVRPAQRERRKMRMEVQGVAGTNTVEFVDLGNVKEHGNGIDNVALYKINSISTQ